MHTLPFGGGDATNMLEKPIEERLKEMGLSFEAVKKEKSTLIREIKEKLSRTNYYCIERELSTPDHSDIEDKAFVLPDGKIITLDRESRFKAGEILLR